MKFLIRAAFAALCLTTSAAAQDYPARSVTIISPFGAGSGSDLVARMFADRLGAELGQTFIVDNKPGASGTLGAGLAARAAPDGYTLVIGGTSSHAASRSLMKQVPYDPVEDFEAIAALGEYPYFLLVNAKDGYTDLKSLIDAIRKNPGTMSFGYGNALGQLSGSVLKATEKLDFTIVPYKSSPATIQDLLGQRIDFMFNDLVAALPQVQDGSLNILAVTTPERTPLMPDVPTLKESGFPFFSITAWSGIFAPKGTPADIIEKLRQALIKITRQDDVKKKLADMGFAVREDHSQSFGDYVAADVKRWADYTKTAGIEPQ